MDIVAWLTNLGLERYANQFLANEIDETVLRDLTTDDLKELGVSALAHRKKLLSAIVALSQADATLTSDGTRRQVTVLFADISAFTQFSRELGAEATHVLLNRYFGIVDGIVERYGGTIDKHIGDNVMAVFGAPRAHNDDPERAIRAACEIHESISDLRTGTAAALQVHIGIASGEVVASGTGSDAHRQYTITGDSVNLASRLQDVAQASETWISEAVQRAVCKVAICEPLVEIAIKGFAQPIRAGRLVGLRTDVGEGETTPIVGRRSELGQFSSILTSCRESGNGQTVYIRGDAGIGKTRLITEVRRLAKENGFSVHTGLFLDFGIAKGQDAIRSIVRSVLNIVSGKGAKDRDDVATRATEVGLIAPKSRIFLNDLLEIPQPQELAALYDTMDNDSRNEGICLAVAGLIRAKARRQPIVIVVEDLHWASPIELRYLAAMARTMGDIPALLVMTSRFDGDPIDQPWRVSAGNGAVATIDLAPFRQAEAIELAQAFFKPDDRFASDCVERAGGNPLFLVQLLHSADESSASAIPASIQSLVQARVDRLRQADRQALQAASIFGQRFAPDAVKHLINSQNYDFEPLRRSFLIQPEGEEFLFSHALVRDGVYSSMLTTQRRELHRIAADWFQDRDTILRAEHLDRAGDPAAADAYLQSAKAEHHQFHFERAAELTKRGLEIVEDLTTRYHLTCLHANLLRELGENEKSIKAFENALETAQDNSQRVPALIGQVEGMRITDRYDEALPLLCAAEALASADRHDEHLAQIHSLRGNIYFPMGNIELCLKEHELALKFARHAGSAEGEARALGGLGDAHYLRGHMMTANKHFRACVDLSQKNGFGRIAVANLNLVGYTAIYLNELEEALKVAYQTINAATAVGYRRAELGARMLAANTLIEMANFRSALSAIEEAENLVKRIGARRFGAHLLIYRSILLRCEGRRDEAIATSTQAVRMANDTGVPFSGPWAMAEFAANVDDSGARNDALMEGERMLADDAVSHCHFHFYTTAMDTLLQSGEWDKVDRYASALESYTRTEPLPWSDFFIARGRILSRFGQGQRDEVIKEQLQSLHHNAAAVGLHLANRKVEAALADW